jgi:hypothetical protein
MNCFEFEFQTAASLQTQSPDLAADTREVLPGDLTLQSEGVGNAGCPRTRSRVCSVVSIRVSHHEYAGNTRHSHTRMVLTAYVVLPGDEFVLVTVIGGCGLSKPGRADAPLPI